MFPKQYDKTLTPVSLKVTLLGNMVFADVVKMQVEVTMHSSGPCSDMSYLLDKRARDMDTDMQRKGCVMIEAEIGVTQP